MNGGAAVKYIGIALLIAAGFALLTLGLAFLLFRLAFGARKTTEKEMFVLPDTDQYRPYAAEARRMIRAALALPYEPVTIRSDDGLTLFGRCYPTAPDAPWLLLFHGYRSAAERDFCGGLPFGMGMGCNVLLVDERAHGKSGGRCLTLGIRERYDCRRWVDYVIGRAGPDAKIVLYGMSMGAAAVLMAAGPELPKNVAGIVADCGYSAPSAILKSVIRSAHLPVFPVYALLRLGCRLFGGFDPEEASAAGAMARCDTPVLFLHGEDDRFVPCAMGRENYACCRAADKTLLTFPAAGHGMSYMADQERYLAAVTDFLGRVFGEEYGTKRLTLSEYDAIVAFDRLCFPQDHWTEEDWRELLADERAVYLALLDDGRIVGDVFVYNWQGERDYGKIMNLAVHPAYRGRRLAAGLLRAATELLQAAGLPRICGETRLSNEAMRRTFAACGYRLTRIEEAYYDHPPESACKYERQFET